MGLSLNTLALITAISPSLYTLTLWGTLLPSRRNLSWSGIYPPPWTGFGAHSFVVKQTEPLVLVCYDEGSCQRSESGRCAPAALWSLQLSSCLSFFLFSVFFFLFLSLLPLRGQSTKTPQPLLGKCPLTTASAQKRTKFLTRPVAQASTERFP